MTSTNQDIEQLLLQCNSGNQPAQLEVYNRYNKVMINNQGTIDADDFKLPLVGSGDISN
ncbi:hypothetical protein [Winogradskyella sp. KYW1333]|uniref:hypothetical protein n=1 Tax=Winogradskyella sp. KYW1333 TaxID=2282123 RepID=UPI0015EFFCCE|nr:hypothetical protein [Winogradskyella sp. KYW1333]